MPDIQFSKAPHALRAMEFDGEKSAKAEKELATKAWRGSETSHQA
jgi:hypothetical protein